MQDISGPFPAPPSLFLYLKEPDEGLTSPPWKFVELYLDPRVYSALFSRPDKSTQCMKFLQYLRVDDEPDFEGALPFPSEKLFPTLRTLDMMKTRVKTCEPKVPRSLQEIKLLGCTLAGGIFSLQQCKSLTSLNIKCCPEVKDISGLNSGLQSVSMGAGYVTAFPLGIEKYGNLTKLDLSFTGTITKLPPDLPTTLEFLNVCYCPDFKHLEEGLRRCENLKVFYAQCCPNLEDLGPLAKNKLRKVRIGSTNVSDISPVCGPDLVELDANFCHGLVDIQQDVNKCSALKYLNLKGCDHIVDLSALDLPTLKYLNCKKCSRLEKLPPRAQSLDTFKLSGCRPEMEFPEAKLLETLWASRLPGLTKTNGLQYSAKLTALTLKNCCALKCISDLQYCAQLQFADLSGCPVSEIDPLASCTKLVVLNLNRCRVQKLSPLQSCTDLRAISLQHNAELTEAELSTCGSLKIVDLRGCCSLGSLNLASWRTLETLDIGLCDRLDLGSVLPQLSDRCSLYVSPENTQSAFDTSAEVIFDPWSLYDPLELFAQKNYLLRKGEGYFEAGDRRDQETLFQAGRQNPQQ